MVRVTHNIQNVSVTALRDAKSRSTLNRPNGWQIIEIWADFPEDIEKQKKDICNIFEKLGLLDSPALQETGDNR